MKTKLTLTAQIKANFRKFILFLHVQAKMVELYIRSLMIGG